MRIFSSLGANMFEEMIHQGMDLGFVGSSPLALFKNTRLTST